LVYLVLHSSLQSQTYKELFYAGSIKYQKGDYKGAIIDYSKAILLNSNNFEPFLLRGLAKIELGDFRGAILDYNQAIQINPNYDEAYINRSYAKAKLNDFTGQILDLNFAIKLKPSPENYIERAKAYIKTGNKENGCLDFSKAGELGHPNAYEYIKLYCN